MGQKVNPIGFRLAVTKDWRSKWYAVGKNYAAKLHEDLRIRKYIKDYTVKVNSDLKGTSPAISRITIERAWNSVRVTISTARPGLVIGPKGKYIEEMTAELTKLCGGAQVKLDILEIRQPELDAQLVEFACAARGVWAVQTLLALSNIVRARCPCRHCVLLSTTVLLRLAHSTASSV